MAGIPALRIPAKEFFVEFVTDGSNEDWGWKFDVEVLMSEKVSKCDPSRAGDAGHWLCGLEDQMNHCFGLVGSRLVTGNAWLKSLRKFGIL